MIAAETPRAETTHRPYSSTQRERLDHGISPCLRPQRPHIDHRERERLNSILASVLSMVENDPTTIAMYGRCETPSAVRPLYLYRTAHTHVHAHHVHVARARTRRRARH